ncbi:hypothetical protein IQ279_23000 [Streptomyces verrucosisporus]|uniref:hypothetical protein n=1 Tax=Streptomyces verrucosisporus TaxID=1695161 RepID=UPI0019D028E7|nr:hypothetical protein [Streptomyces verrucosisporus]MBN3932449.1 hypothetical protein [Streptomyces verrucosisporus]
MRVRGTAAFLPVVTTALLLTTACVGGGDGGPGGGEGPPPPSSAPSAPPPPDPGAVAALKEAVSRYVEAYYEPDAGAVYAMYSARCREKVSEEVVAGTLERAAEANTEGRRYTMERFSADEFWGEDTAYVTYGVGDEPRFDHRKQQWVREKGDWRYDGC